MGILLILLNLESDFLKQANILISYFLHFHTNNKLMLGLFCVLNRHDTSKLSPRHSNLNQQLTLPLPNLRFSSTLITLGGKYHKTVAHTEQAGRSGIIGRSVSAVLSIAHQSQQTINPSIWVYYKLKKKEHCTAYFH